ncbi:MAG: methyltransferase domain-containing protein [Bacteroidota bacterium]
MTDKIISSWEQNASEWIKVMQENSIASRKFTNAAIVEAIGKLNSNKLVDIGCGEGWLTRKIGGLGIEAVGLDAIEDLILEAQKQGSETYRVFTFEDIIADKTIPGGLFDCAVFNFCLYLKDGLPILLQNTLGQLSSNGSILIQTLHPYFLLQNEIPYVSQWLNDSWKGLPGNFKDGHAWYARTFEDWITVLGQLPNSKFFIEEVLNDEQKPVSLIIKIQKRT